ncbi:MAG: bifunctional phosphopantothenoylcysteine decarboxylase/phosphopantothenate--cysteine ligase CoaBC [Xanthobacteraceae bacterium]
MASITIRQLDEALKTALRLRAVAHGRSMEDEVRTILRSAAAAEPARAVAAPLDHQPKTDATQPRVLLIIGGGIAAYKSLDLIRRLKERSITVRCILTRAAQQFITPLSAGALSGGRVFTDLFDTAAEFDVGHIRLAREADAIVVAPATADLIAKMANGLSDDLASAVLLATRASVLVAPAMNPAMWHHPATRRNVEALTVAGIKLVGPNAGEMAEEGEGGFGRMAEPLEIVAVLLPLLTPVRGQGLLAGKRVLVTSGPTHEPLDPVRFIANRSSGKQGHAIAAAAAAEGAEATLVSGPVALPDPPGVQTVKVETAQEMLSAVTKALPVDAAIFAAAVADWRPEKQKSQKMKKERGSTPPIRVVENPDILATVAHSKNARPQLVIGFAAETEHIIENAKAKLARKGCDWIVANDVSAASGVMGSDVNRVHLVSRHGCESWPPQSKDAVAHALVARMAQALSEKRA